MQQRQQVEETEQLVRESLGRAQQKQKAYYDTKCNGQRYNEGDCVWYRNRARARRKKFIKPWCGPWRVTKALSDVTYHTEEEKRKLGRRRRRKVVHFNYLKPCYSPPEEAASHTQTPENSCTGAGRQMQEVPLVVQDVDLEWLEIAGEHDTGDQQPLVEALESETEDGQPLEDVLENSDAVAHPIPAMARPRRERGEPAWLRDFVRAVTC